MSFPSLILSPPPPLWGFRVRLSEGFHFACSGEGIINMVLELPIQVCAIPHDTSPPGSIIRGTLASKLRRDCYKLGLMGTL